MTERYQQYDAGKGPEDRSNSNKRQDCPLWKQVKLPSGDRVTPEEAAKIIEDAYNIIAATLNMEIEYMPKTIEMLMFKWINKNHTENNKT